MAAFVAPTRLIALGLCATLQGLVGLSGAEETDGPLAAIPAVPNKVVVAEDGGVTVLPRFSTDGVNNTWPAKYTDAYNKRVTELLPHFKGQSKVNTTGEREKYDYPMTVGAWLSGDHKQAIAVLEGRDVDAGDHAWTKGIDLYWGFTLKAQVLKFFYLEDQLTPAYRDQMLEAFKIYTSSDPRPTLEYALNTLSTDQRGCCFCH